MLVFDILSALAGSRPTNARVQDDVRRSGARAAVHDAREAAAAALGQTPVGCSVRWWGTEDPAGGAWMVEDGRLLVTGDYPELHAVIGRLFSRQSDDPSTFRLPDTRGRVGVGAGDAPAGVTDRALGTAFGAETTTLAVTQLPAHSHGGSTDSDTHSHGALTNSAGGHRHNLAGQDWTHHLNANGQAQNLGNRTDFGLQWTEADNPETTFDGSYWHGISSDTHSHDVSTDDTGGGQAHSNLQPSIAVNYMIRVLP